MRRTPARAAAAATLVALGWGFSAGVALAASSASSAVSDSLSTSVGSISTSFNASSDASSPGRPLKTGAYRITDIQLAAGRAGYARLTLQEQAAGGSEAPDAPAAAEQHLFLPLATVAAAALQAGQVIQARARPYGLELAKVAADAAAPATPFFLIVSDERYRELQTRPVSL
jgi:hypothetical protein